MNEMPDQRTSVADKKKKTWYIPMADFVIDLATSSNNKEFTKKCLDCANGIVDKKDYAYVMKTYSSANENVNIEDAMNAEKLGLLRDIDILTPIKEKYMGEFINSYHNYQVYSLDPNVIMKRNAVIGEKIVNKMFAKLQEILSQQEEGSPEMNIKAFIDQELENFKNDVVASEQDALEMLNSTIDAKRKYIDAYFYWWACEEVYTYRRISGRDVDFDVVSPLDYYRVDSGNFLVEDDNYGCRRTTVTIQEIIDKFYNGMEDGLSEKQLTVLNQICKEAVNGYGLVTPEIFVTAKEFTRSNTIVDKPVRFTKKGLQTTLDHWVAKTQIKKGILTYTNTFGVESEMDVNEDYVLDEANGDISIEWKWINQTWEGWRFGDKAFYMYIPARPVDLPRELISNSSVCKLPYNGASYIHKGSAKKPIPIRIKDNIALYKIYTLLEERWANKFKSWLLMPESILTDSKQFSVEERLQQADVDSMLPFNDANLRENPQAANYFREIATTSVIDYLKILNLIKEGIKQNAWELANYNAARAGMNNQYKGKGVNEQDYAQAVTGTIWSLEMFNSFREKDYMANLDYSRAAWVDGKQGSFVDPDTKELRYVDIDGEAHLGANIGITIANSAQLNAQAKALQELAFSAGQNNDPSMAADAITVTNISKLKKLISKGVQANRDFQMKLATAKEDAVAKAAEITLADNREKRQHESDLMDKEIAGNLQIAIIESDTDIEINQARLELDTNGNGYIDTAESERNASSDAARLRAVDRLENRKTELAKLKMGLDNKKNADKAKQMASKSSKK